MKEFDLNKHYKEGLKLFMKDHGYKSKEKAIKAVQEALKEKFTFNKEKK